VGSQSDVADTDNQAPVWSGPAGSRWVACSCCGVTLPPGDYEVAVYDGGGSNWLQVTNYWASGGPGAAGIVTGPLAAPGTAKASGPAQCTYNQGGWAYPSTYAAGGGGENYWVHVQVTPS